MLITNDPYLPEWEAFVENILLPELNRFKHSIIESKYSATRAQISRKMSVQLAKYLKEYRKVSNKRTEYITKRRDDPERNESMMRRTQIIQDDGLFSRLFSEPYTEEEGDNSNGEENQNRLVSN